MAVIASGINSGSGFGSSDAVTSTNLNNHVNLATFVAGGSGSTDNDTLEVHTDGKLRAKDSSSKTTGITFAKMQHISTAKVLGNVSGSEGDVSEVSFLNEGTLSSNSATAVASQQSIKTYVDKAAVFEQVILPHTFEFTNNASTSVTPTQGNKGDDYARYLIQDNAGNQVSKQITITSGNKVKIHYNIYGDTNDSNVGVAFFLERSTNNGSSFAIIPAVQAAADGNKLRATSNMMHGYGKRNLGYTSYTYIDTPGVTNPIYRVTMSILSGYRFRLNRCNNDEDNDGYAVYTSNLLLEEVQA